MKTTTSTLLATLAVAFLGFAALSPQANAVMISGGISLGGAYTTDTGNINTANAFTSFAGVFNASCSGDYAGVPTGGSSPAITMNPFTFDPFGGPVVPLWTFVSGGLTYSFDLTSASILFQGHNALILTGAGDLNMTGFDTTPGSWVFTANQGGGSFSFSSSNASVPEGGSAVALLGLALVGIEMIRRKLVVE